MQYNGVKPKLQVVNMNYFCDNYLQLGKKLLSHGAGLQLLHVHPWRKSPSAYLAAGSLVTL